MGKNFKHIIDTVVDNHPTWTQEGKRQVKASHSGLILEALVAQFSPKIIEAICKEHGIKGNNGHIIKALHVEAVRRRKERTDVE